jgi:hypothetical protein
MQDRLERLESQARSVQDQPGQPERSEHEQLLVAALERRLQARSKRVGAGVRRGENDDLLGPETLLD